MFNLFFFSSQEPQLQINFCPLQKKNVQDMFFLKFTQFISLTSQEIE